MTQPTNNWKSELNHILFKNIDDNVLAPERPMKVQLQDDLESFISHQKSLSSQEGKEEMWQQYHCTHETQSEYDNKIINKTLELVEKEIQQYTQYSEDKDIKNIINLIKNLKHD